jgi:hypothetical protein
MFTTSTAATPSVQTPLDSPIAPNGVDPIVVATEEVADRLPLVVGVGNEDVDAEQAVATSKKRDTLILAVKKAGASAKKLVKSLTNVSIAVLS